MGTVFSVGGSLKIVRRMVVRSASVSHVINRELLFISKNNKSVKNRLIVKHALLQPNLSRKKRKKSNNKNVNPPSKNVNP
jgi:hypothetical protein